MRKSIVLVAFMAAGCGGPTDVIGTDGQLIADECDARSQRGLVGTELEDRAALSAAAPKVRYIGPGGNASSDIQPDRLNVVLDSNNIVTRVFCG